MELTQLADSTRRLAEAFETSQTSEGSQLVGTGDRSPVPQEMADRFRELLERPAEAQPSPENRPAGAVSEAGWRAERESVQRTGSSDLAADAAQSADAAQQSLPSPMELLQVQFHVNMSHFTTKFFSNIQDQATSQLEQTLKSKS